MEKIESESLTIEIETENGKIACEVIAAFEMEETNYIALLPQTESADEILFFRYNELPYDQIEIFNIHNDSEFDNVLECFDNLVEVE